MQRPTPPSAPRAPGRLAARALAGTALALLLGATACSPSEDQVEDALERELQSLVGPADRYDVDIEGLRARDGEADRIVAVGVGVRPRGAPAIDRIDLELNDVRYDRDDKRLERLESAHAVATIRASDLGRFLERQGAVQDADVRLEEPDRAVIRFRPDLGIPLPGGATAEVTGRFVASGSYIRFEIEDVRAAGLGLGGTATRAISGLINPLVDLSELPLDLEVTDARVVGGVLRLEATGSASSLRP